MSKLIVACLLAAAAASACGGRSAQPVRTAPPAAQREVAVRFAAAVLRGDSAGARALLVPTDDGALAGLVRRAAAPWRGQHASIRVPVRSGNRWLFRYAATRTEAGGAFERQTGDLVVVVSPTAAGAAVQYFAFTHVRSRFGTHHDSQLLPSNR